MSFDSNNWNFMDAFMYASGVTQIPQIFFQWAGLSLIAACLADRVFYEKFPGDKLRPNLYTLLIAPSGIGKGKAIDFATSFVQSSRYSEIVNPYRAKLTGAGFSDVLCKPKRDDDGKIAFDPDIPPIVWVITPELSMSLGEKKIADDFVKRMTELYTGGDYVYNEATRGHGEQSYRAPTLNWLGGTTNPWLHESVSRTAIESGFFGRAIPIEIEDYSGLKLHTDPWYPHDRDEVMEELRRHVRWMTCLEGKFTLSNQAREVRDAWYPNRPMPTDPAEMPAWMRADDLALKLGMILAVAAGREDFTITAKHMTRAIQLTQEAHRAVPHLVSTASQTPASTSLDIVREFISLAKRIPHSALLKKVSHRGIHAKELAIHIDTLKQQRFVKSERNTSGAAVYVWTPKTQEVFNP